MTNQSSAFSTLQDLAQQALDNAHNKVKQAEQIYCQAQEQLNVLNDYVQEYQQRLNRALTTGVMSGDLTNYHLFITQLEQAIRLQQQRMVTLNIKQQQAIAHFYQCHKKLSAYNVLQEKQQQRHQQQQQRLQQKLTDEFSQQQVARKKRSKWLLI